MSAAANALSRLLGMYSILSEEKLELSNTLIIPVPAGVAAVLFQSSIYDVPGGYRAVMFDRFTGVKDEV